MNELAYDIFIKGVVPLAIVGVLGYAAKKFGSLEGAPKWKISAFLVVAAILAGGLYFQHSVLFAGYRTQFIPETSNIVGATLKTNIERSFWEVTKGSLISLPILVKKHREISVYLEIDKAPLSIEYYAERGAHKVVLNETVAPLFERKPTEELQGDQAYLTDPISKFGERILVIKAKIDADAKIYSYTVERYYTPITSWLFLVFMSFLWLIPALSVVIIVSKLMHSKKTADR